MNKTRINFNARVKDDIVLSLANNINLEVDHFKLNVKENSTGKAFIENITHAVLAHIEDIRFSEKTSSELGAALNRAVEVLPIINLESSKLILKLFHQLDAAYKSACEYGSDYKMTPVLKPAVLVDVCLSEKTKPDALESMYYSMFRYEHQNDLVFDNNFFDGVDKASQVKWFKLLYSKLNAFANSIEVNSWLSNQLDTIIEYIKFSDAKELGFDLFMQTIAHAKSNPEVIGENAVAYPLEKNEINNNRQLVLYSHQAREEVTSLILFLYKDIERFKTLFNTALALDCYYDANYWRSALKVEPVAYADIKGIEL